MLRPSWKRIVYHQSMERIYLHHTEIHYSSIILARSQLYAEESDMKIEDSQISDVTVAINVK